MTMPFLRRRPQASRLPHPEDLSKATYPSTCRSSERSVSDNDTPGFLMGAVAADQPECSSRFSIFIPFMAFLTGVFWFVVACISFTTTRGNVSFQRNLNCQAVAGGAVTQPFDNGFGVDSCASDHICHDKGMFSTLDSSKYKTFEVVHGETITLSGVGDVELL